MTGQGRPTDYTEELAAHICSEVSSGRSLNYKVYIYGLYDAQGNLRYIGKANDPQQRLKGHIRSSARKNYPVSQWIAKHGAPEMRVIEETNAECWQSVERRLIAGARRSGVNLLNVADGGESPHCPTDVRVKNAIKATASRPKNVMRCYRRMESFIRMAKKNGCETEVRLVEALDAFKASVARNRANGTLALLDERLGKYLEAFDG